MLALAASPVVAAWDVASGRGLRPIAERLGWTPRFDPGNPAVQAAWFTAASAGEVAAALPLLQRLAREPARPILLSVLTPHGVAAAGRHAALLDAAPFHPPVDILPCVALGLGRLRPRALITVETEIWPNLFRSCQRRAIPVAIVNARLSERSLPRYRRIRALIAPLLAEVSLVAARSDEDAARFTELGARPDRVHVTGNVKFDAAASLAREPELPWAREAGLSQGSWLVLGSTAEGEEGALLDAFAAVAARTPSLRCLLAPKRPERWDAVARLVEARALPLTRRSRFGAGGGASPEIPAGGVLLLDSIGELARAYRHARVAFVGGSLVPHGGQNLLEPAAWGVPVLFGAHVANFRDAEEALLAAGGGRRVGQDLADEIRALVEDDTLHARMGAAAREAVRRHEGAADRTIHLLSPLLDMRGSPP